MLAIEKEKTQPLNNEDNEVVVSVQNVSKKFCKSLRRSMAYGIVDLSKNLFGIKQDSSILKKNEFWALEDINFELHRHETLGLIGPNGSGKTTLLRLLAGIFPPDKGEIRINGRVGALIAVGAGFHPHMSGRENIFLNGAILGMSNQEIKSKFDDIVDFAEIENFLDAPISTYSSGMRVKLGFSIATAVNPDLLLIDEILAVGDLAFRTRCFNRLNNMKRQGVPFILVSHNISNILQFTDRTIWLSDGYLLMDEDSLPVTSAYINSQNGNKKYNSAFGEVLENHPGLEKAQVYLTNGRSATEISEISLGASAVINFHFKVKQPLLNPNVSFPIYNENGLLMTTVASVGRGISLEDSKNTYSGSVKFGPVILNPGNYFIVSNLHDGPEHLFRKLVARFRVISDEKRITWGFIDFHQEWFV